MNPVADTKCAVIAQIRPKSTTVFGQGRILSPPRGTYGTALHVRREPPPVGPKTTGYRPLVVRSGDSGPPRSPPENGVRAHCGRYDLIVPESSETTVIPEKIAPQSADRAPDVEKDLYLSYPTNLQIGSPDLQIGGGFRPQSADWRLGPICRLGTDLQIGGPFCRSADRGLHQIGPNIYYS